MSHPLRAVPERAQRIITEFLEPAIHRSRQAVPLTHWEVPGEPVPFSDTAKAEFTPIATGSRWGRPWGTTWFKVVTQVPPTWHIGQDRLELDVNLGFTKASPGFQAEALAFDSSGSIIKAVEPLNTTVPVHADPGEWIELYLEAASNPDIARDGDFSPTHLGSLDTAGREPLYRLRSVDLAVRDQTVWELIQDLHTLVSLCQVLPADRPRRAHILMALSRALDALHLDAISQTAAAARQLLEPVLASPATASAHQIIATGHAHIDSAWLWPVRETIRKCARTFSNVLDLMDQDPEFVFACSSAQQYAWVKEFYPELFERIRERVAQGRFIPVGGMWVESDTNMPGGEAMVRQFVAGKRFFATEFGVDPLEVWLPDSFGYSAALPQIARGVGARWFLTQKISWNDTNTMPHHTFAWEGIDGTQIFTHFPPVDTYNSDVSIADLDRAERQFADHAGSSYSLLPFGYGDGGGGPTAEMTAAARRAASLEGAPQVRIASPQTFFELAEQQYSDPPVWSGELYLELHRGTYTSQARTKRGNRRSEQLLHEAELWSTTAAVRGVAPYPQEQLEGLWHRVLLHQFHDILPGTSIAWVHREAERAYAEIAGELEEIIASRLSALSGSGSTELRVNSAPATQAGNRPYSITSATTRSTKSRIITSDAGGHILENEHLRVHVDGSGLLRSAIHLATGRNAIPAGQPAGLLQLHPDQPVMWDAWDIDRHYRQVSTDLTDVHQISVDETSNEPALIITRHHGESRFIQRLHLDPDAPTAHFTLDIDWRERRSLLKFTFPTTIQADRFASETQFGHVQRPTHVNTSWEEARYETCAHRWVHITEGEFGVALANDSTYGHDVTRSRSSSGAPGTTVRLSLLRAPTFPDPDADQGRHTLRVALQLGGDVTAAAELGYHLNLPLRQIAGAREVEPLVQLLDAGAFIETVKLAEDGSDDVIIRLYESTGNHRRVRLRTTFPWTRADLTDLLERPMEASVLAADGSTDGTFTLNLTPFQITTIRFQWES